MLKEHESFLKRLLIAVDLCLVSAAFLLGHYLRNHMGWILEFEAVDRAYPIGRYLNLIPYLLIFWTISLFAGGAYNPMRARSIFSILWDITKATALATLLFGGLAYAMKLTYVSRILIALISGLSFLFISIERCAVVYLLKHLHKKGYYTKFLLVVGTGSRAQNYLNTISVHNEWGLKVVGLLDTDPSLVGKTISGYPVLGTLDDLIKILEEQVIDEVIYIVPRKWLGEIEDSILCAENLGKRVSVAVDLFNTAFARPVQRNLGSLPLLTFETTTSRIWQAFVKRVMDIILSLIAILILAPFMAAVALVIYTTSGGPIIFRQTRCGLNGRKFTVYKFRTMIVDAEKHLAKLEGQNEMTDGPAFKMKDDPRIIKYGKFMRKFSIDELPQLFNILQGDMSFVGPRPPIPAEVAKYKPWQRRRLSMRPGLTCIWQVQGRSRIVKFDEWMTLDLQYIDNWSLALDLSLFFKTIPIVILGIGAK